MKLLWRLGKEAGRYKALYLIAILSTLALTLVNLTAPKILSNLTGLIESGLQEGALQEIGRLTLLLTVLYLSRILFRFLANYLAHKAAWNLVEELRVRVYGKIQGLSMSFFSHRQTGDLMSRVVNDTASFELLYAHIIPEMITNFVTVAGVMAILLTINVRLALLTCLPIPLILFSGYIFATRVRPSFRISQQATADLNAKLQDNFSGIHEIQAFGKDAIEAQQVQSKARIYTTAMLRALKLSAIFHPSVEFLSAIGTILVVGVGGVLAFRGTMSVADIVAFLLYLALFYTPISGIARLLEDVQQAYAGAERVDAMLQLESDIVNKPDAQPLHDVKGALEFRNVGFYYEEDMPILQDISFACEPGQMVALVGPTGVGKTTLTQLISRFYDPTSGAVLVDGIDVRDVTYESLRAQIAPVLQDTFLFNGTIAENIRYACPEADFAQVEAAAKAARIHADIMSMAEGYETQVGERGMRLSGGQKQRIAIARAILRQAPIIILDEATASVDVETEQQIQQAIQDLAGRRTLVVIAHRLSTVQKADLILVLEEGRIVQRGTHRQLIETPGLYQKLNNIQNQLTHHL